MTESILEKLLAAKKYADVCPDTLRRVAEEAAMRYKKPKKFKDISKRRPYDRNEFSGTLLAQRFEYAENEWIKDYIPRPSGIGEEDVIDVIKDIIEKYEPIIAEF